MFKSEDNCPRATDLWSKYDQTIRFHGNPEKCSYCGSLSETAFLEAIEAGCKVIQTDKIYKAYVMMPNPIAGKTTVCAMSNHRQEGWIEVTEENLGTLPWDRWCGEGREPDKKWIGQWVSMSPEGERTQEKFYFMHLCEESMKKFVALLNEKKINIGYPGYFYVTPYFIAYDKKEGAGD